MSHPITGTYVTAQVAMGSKRGEQLNGVIVGYQGELVILNPLSSNEQVFCDIAGMVINPDHDQLPSIQRAIDNCRTMLGISPPTNNTLPRIDETVHSVVDKWASSKRSDLASPILESISRLQEKRPEISFDDTLSHLSKMAQAIEELRTALLQARSQSRS